MGKMYSKQHLLQALKKEGLPSTYKSLLKYEKAGIVPTGDNAIGFGISNRWRLYTEDEIKQIVDTVKKHKAI